MSKQDNREEIREQRKKASRESANKKSAPDTTIAGIDKELFNLEKRIEALEKKVK